MANLLNQTPAPAPAPAAPRTYSESDLRAVEAQTAARLLSEQNRVLQQAALQREQPRQVAPTGPDPLKVYAEKNLTMTGDENARLLDQGMRGRARAEINKATDALRSEYDEKLTNTKNELALTTILAANPDIAADQDGFAAAIGQAQYRNPNLDPISQAQFAVQIYRSQRQAQPQAPYVEGVSRPTAGYGGQQQDKPKPPSEYEKRYGGVDSGDELHEEEWDDASQVLSYLDGKNELLEKMGVQPDQSVIRQVKGEAQARRARAKQRGAA